MDDEHPGDSIPPIPTDSAAGDDPPAGVDAPTRDPRPRSQVARIPRRHAVRRRRLIALAAILVLVAVAAAAAGLALAERSEDKPRQQAAVTTTLGGDDAAITANSTSSAAATTTLQPGPPHVLTVKTVPAKAHLTVHLSDGTTLEGTTPFKKTVPGGRITLSLSATGRNDATREVNLIKDRAVTVLLDPKGLLHRSIGRFTTGSNPKQVAFTPDGKEIWASLLGGRGLQVFDSAGNELGDIILGTKGGAVEVIFTRDGTTAYASQMETASVFEIDRVTRKVLRQLPTKGVWTKVLTLSPDEKTLYAANWSSNDVSEIDLATGAVRRRIPTVVTPRGLYITPDGARMYVAGYDNGEIQRIDLGTGKGKVLLKTGGAMRHMVGNPAGTRLYADDMAKDVVFVVDLTTDTVTQLAKTDEKPNTIDLTPDGRVLYVSCRGENGSNYYLPGPEWGSVVAIDAQTGRVLDAMVGGNQCTGLDVSPDGKMLAFSDFLDNKVRLYAIPPTQTLLDGDGGRATTHLADIAKN